LAKSHNHVQHDIAIKPSNYQADRLNDHRQHERKQSRISVTEAIAGAYAND